MHHFLGIILALVLTVAPANSRQLTPSEYDALNAVVEKFITDMEMMEMGGITNAIPARIINDISASVGMGPERVRHVMAVQMKGAMSDVTSISIDIDLSDLNVTDAQNTDGTDSIYAVLPYAMSATIKGKTASASSILIVMHETGRWWLARVAPGETERLIKLYPFLKNIKF